MSVLEVTVERPKSLIVEEPRLAKDCLAIDNVPLALDPAIVK